MTLGISLEGVCGYVCVCIHTPSPVSDSMCLHQSAWMYTVYLLQLLHSPGNVYIHWNQCDKNLPNWWEGSEKKCQWGRRTKRRDGRAGGCPQAPWIDPLRGGEAAITPTRQVSSLIASEQVADFSVNFSFPASHAPPLPCLRAGGLEHMFLLMRYTFSCVWAKAVSHRALCFADSCWQWVSFRCLETSQPVPRISSGTLGLAVSQDTDACRSGGGGSTCGWSYLGKQGQAGAHHNLVHLAPS